MKFQERLKTLRLEAGLTQGNVAELLNISQQSVQKYEKGNGKPLNNNLEKLAKIFDVSISYLLGETDVRQPSTILNLMEKLSEEHQQNIINYATNQLQEQEEANTIFESSLFTYRVYQKLSAWTGYSYTDELDYEEVHYDEDLAYDFASWIYGDSMTPKYEMGEVALISTSYSFRDGSVYAVDWDGQSYIKKVYKEKDGLRLVSINPNYSDKFAPFEENPRIIGEVTNHFFPIEE
jgi:phage repressor protein C with HTH and peptisase S24 domain